MKLTDGGSVDQNNEVKIMKLTILDEKDVTKVT